MKIAWRSIPVLNYEINISSLSNSNINNIGTDDPKTKSMKNIGLDDLIVYLLEKEERNEKIKNR